MSREMENARRWLREALDTLESPSLYDVETGRREYDFGAARESVERALDNLRRLAPNV